MVLSFTSLNSISSQLILMFSVAALLLLFSCFPSGIQGRSQEFRQGGAELRSYTRKILSHAHLLTSKVEVQIVTENAFLT